MPARPMRPKTPALAVIPVPPCPPNLPPDQQKLWPFLADQVNLAGTYTAAMEQAFQMLVKVVAGAMALDLSGGADNADTRLLTQASTWLGKFGLTPADAPKVPAAPPTSEADLDGEFSQQPAALRVVGKAK